MSLRPSELLEIVPIDLLSQEFFDFLPDEPEDNSVKARQFTKPPADGQGTLAPLDLSLSLVLADDPDGSSDTLDFGILGAREFRGITSFSMDEFELVIAASHREGHEGGGPGGGGGGPGGGGGGGGESTDPLTYYKAGGKDKGPNDKYNIEIDFIGEGWTLELQQAFIDAADSLTSIITQGLGDILTTYIPTGEIMKIDDLRFTAELYEGEEGEVLGYGGPYIYTDYSLMPREQPYQGLIAFDSLDIPYLTSPDVDLWYEVVLHEMLHVLGVGTIWEPLGLVAPTDNNTKTEWVFTGENALSQYLSNSTPKDLIEDGWLDGDGDKDVDINDVDGVPIQQYADGSAGGHWLEPAFGDELMTPYLNGSATLTDLTLASLIDLGYTIDETALVA